MPLGGTPRPIREVFDPKKHRERRILTRGEIIPMRDHWTWTILMGLRSIKLPVLGHVNAFHLYPTSIGRKLYQPLHPISVTITDLPVRTDKGGFPMIMSDGKVVVRVLENFSLTYAMRLADSDTKSESWTEYFMKGLKDREKCLLRTAEGARKRAVYAQERADFLSEILSRKETRKTRRRMIGC